MDLRRLLIVFSTFLIVRVHGLGPGASERLLCAPHPVAALRDLHYDKFSGDWKEIMKSPGPPDVAPFRAGLWRIDMLRSTFAYTAVVDESFSCITPIVGKVDGQAPNGSIRLEYEYFGKRVQEPVKIVATDYTTFAILYFCAWSVPDLAVCAPEAVHVTVLARHGLDEEASLKIIAQLRRICVDRSMLLPQDSKNVDCAIEAPMTASEGGEEIPELEMCFKPMDTGFCHSNIPAFFYNATSRKCESFHYTGCGGNANNFFSELECLSRCQQPLEDIRKAKAATIEDPFRCSNASCGLSCPPCCTMGEDGCVSCSCEKTGLEPWLGPATCVELPNECPPECQAVERSRNCYDCRCQMPDGSLQPAVEYKTFDPTFRCPPMCQLKPSPLGRPRCHCVSHATCNLPLEEGSCSESVLRYFYNITAARCDVFTYKGCTANDNNFATHDDCMATCADVCHFPKDPGPCTDKPSERYFYNPQTGQCEAMTYGGCGGNENNFNSVAACRTKCQDACSQEYDPGTCYAYLRRFYYDAKERMCLPFVYGGCMGNGNNFYSEEQCKKRCQGTAPPIKATESNKARGDRALCHLPLEEGKCDDASQQKPELRFYYDAEKQECSQFKYAGCGGNDNNFRSLHGCNLTCFGSTISAVQPSRICPEVKCGCNVTIVDKSGCPVCDCSDRGGTRAGSGTLSPLLAAYGAALAIMTAIYRWHT